MRKRVFKYYLKHGTQMIQLPKEHQILTAGAQESRLVMWVLLDPASEEVPVEVCAVRTGRGMDPPKSGGFWVYVSTVTVEGLVYHVFRAAATEGLVNQDTGRW